MSPEASLEIPMAKPLDTEAPSCYFNRELSWLKFNERVLEEALDEGNPLLERVNFLAIFFSNLDEFFMIRVSGLKRQVRGGVLEAPPDGMSPVEQLVAIEEVLRPRLAASQEFWHAELLPSLRASGVNLLDYDELDPGQKALLRDRFKRDIFPVLTPLAFDPGHPFPHISSLSLNLAVVVRGPGHEERFARLKLPQTLPRLVRVPEVDRSEPFDEMGLSEESPTDLVWLEDVVSANLDLLFQGVDVVAAYPFRVTRDADLAIEEDEASDLLSAMAEVVEQRHFGRAIRLELDPKTPPVIREILVRNVGVKKYQIYEMQPIGLADLAEMRKLRRPDLKFPEFLPLISGPLASEENIFSVLRRRNIVLYHPYDSFAPVINFLSEASRDPAVLAIKQTLYRVGPNSPIVQSLMEARQNGKQVSALVELKARFDEENNIGWAQALDRAGVHVVYGVVGLKTHAKMSLVVRRESDGIRRYVHLSSGNYNPITARIYTDLGFFTCREEIADDVSDLFNALTGYSKKTDYRKLLTAPGGMRRGIIERIEREMAGHTRKGGGRIAFKMNALVDKSCIQALYRASRAGVEIDLQVRSICCLRPGVPGLSENIRVTSIVGRFLEHSRVYYFRNGGQEELLVGSADLMPRNLDNRVEILFPIEDPQLQRAIRDDVLFPHLHDSVKCWRLLEDGDYRRCSPEGEGAASFDSQLALLEEGGSWRLDE